MWADGRNVTESKEIWLVVGLGNPGPKYQNTRHNVGFLALDFIAKKIAELRWQNKFSAEYSKVKQGQNELVFLKPQTFMNLSGKSVLEARDFFKVPLDRIVVLHDDVDQSFGSLKIQRNRGHGGHNGVRNISELFGSADYLRFKIGVGKSANPHIPTADHVLSDFFADEQAQLPKIFNHIQQALDCLISEGIGKSSSLFNGNVLESKN